MATLINLPEGGGEEAIIEPFFLTNIEGNVVGRPRKRGSSELAILLRREISEMEKIRK